MSRSVWVIETRLDGDPSWRPCGTPNTHWLATLNTFRSSIEKRLEELRASNTNPIRLFQARRYVPDTIEWEDLETIDGGLVVSDSKVIK